MALTVFTTDSGQFAVRGVAYDPTVTAPLGRRYFQVGAHTIGFDDNFAEPLVVRSYYERAKDLKATAKRSLTFIGYMQFMRLAFRTIPIPPGVYRGRLADRQPYVFSADQTFIDFMGPAQARPDLFDVESPFYPYNALLVNDTLVMPDGFYASGLRNGSLLGPGTADTQSAVASLVAEVAPGLLTPADVTGQLSDDNLLTLISPSALTVASTEAYRIALDWLETNPLPDDESGTSPWLAGLDESQVAAQLVGNYVLLTMPDTDENFGDTLVIYTKDRQGGGTDVAVHVLDEYEMAGMTGDAARDLLTRIYMYLLEVGKQPQVGPAPKGRGSRGLSTPPFSVPADEVTIELKYWTIPVGYRQRPSRNSPQWEAFDGITWAVLFQYSEDTGELTPASIRAPAPVDSVALEAALKAYDKARKSSAAAGQLIDTSNFTKAAMLRQNFGGGTKLDFVNSIGVVLP